MGKAFDATTDRTTGQIVGVRSLDLLGGEENIRGNEGGFADDFHAKRHKNRHAIDKGEGIVAD